MKLQSMFAITLALLALALGGCDAVKGKGVAESAVVTFHEQVNKGDYAAIYSGADQDFRSAAPEKDFLALMGAIRKKLGSVQSSSETDFAINTFNLDTKVKLLYKTKFDGGDGDETFTFRVNGGKALLVGYNINSLAMVVK